MYKADVLRGKYPGNHRNRQLLNTYKIRKKFRLKSEIFLTNFGECAKI